MLWRIVYVKKQKPKHIAFTCSNKMRELARVLIVVRERLGNKFKGKTLQEIDINPEEIPEENSADEDNDLVEIDSLPTTSN
ncbi:hypothetical protein PGB90_000749 [Kerria lacca]